MTHIDLFSGIGGFALACEWAGIETEVFCENDKRCQKFLQQTYPGVPIVSDVREFDGTKWRGRFLLTAGVPCQPASRAGKQRGKDDDRWLWPEALRVVNEAKPTWCLFENPPGIGDVGLAGILADLENQGYETRVLSISACAVGSPQIRNRYWIVANSTQAERTRLGQQCIDVSIETSQGDLADTTGTEHTEHQTEQEGRDQDGGYSAESDLADTENNRHTRNGGSWAGGTGFKDEITTDQKSSDKKRDAIINRRSDFRENIPPAFWSNSVWIPCADGKIRRAPDDSFGVVDGLHRSVLAGLGNSIVPQVAYEIIKAIKQITTSPR